MKIALFLPNLHGGGAERMMLNLARELKSYPISIDLIVANLFGDYISLIPEGIEVFNLNSKKTIFSIFKLKKYIETNQPDILISTLRRANVTAVLSKILSKRQFKLILREANTFSSQAKIDETIPEKILNVLCKLLYPKADSIVAVSKEMANELVADLKINSGKIICIYNPVVDEMIQKKTLEKPEHKWLIQKNEKVIIGIGRITPQKDFETLIRAFSIVKKEIPSKLIILGKPDQSNGEFEKLIKIVSELNIKNDVDFPGFVDNPFSYLANSDLFVLSSKFEGLPGALIQALYCGCPVVSTDCPTGPREILENGRFGLLSPPGDWQKLALNMLRTLKEPLTKNELQQRGSYFSSKKSGELYYDLCLKLHKENKK